MSLKPKACRLRISAACYRASMVSRRPSRRPEKSTHVPAEHRRHGSARQRRRDLRGDGCRNLGEGTHELALERRERHTVTIDHTIRADGANAVAGRDDSREIQRIGRAERDETALWRRAAYFAQTPDHVGQRKLLARHAGDAPSAPDFTARFEPAIHAGELAPRGDRDLARQDAPEHDTVATEQRARLDPNRSVRGGARGGRAAAP